MATIKIPKRAITAHTALRDRWLIENPPTLFTRDEFFRYEDGIWVPHSEHLIRLEVLKMLETRSKADVNASILSSVFTLGKVSVSVDSRTLDAKPNLLRCNNGTLELDTRTLRPHSQGDYLTSGVSFDYDPSAKAPAWTRFLDRLSTVLSPEIVSFLQEFAGLCVTTKTEYEIAVWLHGIPGSGRSSFVEGLAHALKDRTKRLSLATLEKSQFALADLAGKTLVVATEQPAGRLQSTYILNQIISGETIAIERKYHDAQEIRPTCKLLWAMNDLPEIDSANNGIFRRLQTIEFPVLPENERDPQVKEQIFRESAGLLNWALDGLDALEARGQFLIPQVLKNANSEFRRANDAEAEFVDEVMRTGAGMQISASELYQHYNDWCKRTLHKQKSSTKVARDWKRLGFKQIHTRNGNFWTGIGW